YSLEDTNKDGKLTPGAIAILDDNSPPVFNGRATMSISYPQNFANWVKVRLRVSAAASTSLSTEGIDYVDVLLQAPNDALKAGDNGNPAPPGGMFASPFGVAADCSVPN
ncbi:MAG: hypothetical protein VW339_03300, partial [Quisquiliibacterium sp.]